MYIASMHSLLTSGNIIYESDNSQCDYANQDPSTVGLSAKEVEENSKPYLCAVGAGCTKRYRQMNGLKVCLTHFL